jgi:hypothetical protein
MTQRSVPVIEYMDYSNAAASFRLRVEAHFPGERTAQ